MDITTHVTCKEVMSDICFEDNSHTNTDDAPTNVATWKIFTKIVLYLGWDVHQGTAWAAWPSWIGWCGHKHKHKHMYFSGVRKPQINFLGRLFFTLLTVIAGEG